MFEEPVARGAALNDRLDPGWARKIALDRLAMRECDDCIWGQLYGGYYSALDQIRSIEGLEYLEPHEYGFTIYGPDGMLTDDCGRLLSAREAWSALADTWRVEIRNRLKSLNLTDAQIDEAAFRMALRTVRLDVHQAVQGAAPGILDDEDEESIDEVWEADQDESQVPS